mgnify:CR=1 FL=1
MATLSQMREKIQALRSNIITIAGECMLENKQEIAQLVVDQQYDKGISGDGVALSDYTPSYKKRKEKLGAYRGLTDYHLTGRMQAEMTLSVQDEMYDIYSTREVPSFLLSDLLKKRDANSFELTQENKKEAWRIIEPSFVEKLNELL